MGAPLSDVLARESARSRWLDAIRHGWWVVVVGCFSAVASATAAAPRRDAIDCEQTPACALEANCECQVPGITARWRAAYCMAVEQTDDLEQAGVQRCLSRPEPSAIRHSTACGKNEYWKRMICRATPRRTDVEGCVSDRSFIPTIVARGAGGPDR